jgi:hypothetical protein
MAIVSAFLIVAATAGATTPKVPVVLAQVNPPQSAEPAKKERKICRTSYKVGSRVSGVRTCHTKAEWDEFEAETRSTIREFQQERQGSPTNGG